MPASSRGGDNVGAATAATSKSWRDVAASTASAQPKRFTLSRDEQKAQARLYEHLPRLQSSISKAAKATGYAAMAIVTNTTPKRPTGEQSKKRSQMLTTFHAVAAGGDVASGDVATWPARAQRRQRWATRA